MLQVNLSFPTREKTFQFIDSIAAAQIVIADMQEINGFTAKRNHAHLSLSRVLQVVCEYGVEMSGRLLLLNDALDYDCFVENLQEAQLNVQEIKEINGSHILYDKAESCCKILLERLLAGGVYFQN